MKIFIYKTLFVFVCIFLLFQFTVGSKIKQLNNEVEKFKSQKNINDLKNKLRDELRDAVNKENYLTPEDAKLINDYINKIKKELSNSN
jgi:protein-arginine kinase activator protein McsA|tara:strand:- start:55 stop:318 length:264 start_codon:yes stop_codon:yes gene_type:complete